MLRRVLPVLLVLAAAVVIVAALVPLPGGPLDEGGNGSSAPRQAGLPFTVGAYSLKNDGRWPLEVEEVRLGEGVKGLVFLGAVTTSGDHPGFVFADGFPPDVRQTRLLSLERVKYRSAVGSIVPARSRVALFVGLIAPQPGRFRLERLEVRYRVRVAGGLGPLFRRTLRDDVRLCAQREPLGPESCEAPSLRP